MLQEQNFNSLKLSIDSSLKGFLFFMILFMFMPMNEGIAANFGEANSTITNNENDPVESAPQFPGGEAEMMNFIYQHIEYPEAAKTENGEGFCMVSFTIEKNGSVSNIEVAEAVEGDLGTEVKRVINMMPNWIPAEYKGRKVRKKINLPIRFKMG